MVKYASSARAGDIARCINGHDLYRLLADVVPGSVMQSSMFEPIGDTPKPQYGQQIERCHICGTPWVTSGPGGGWVFCNLRRQIEI